MDLGMPLVLARGAGGAWSCRVRFLRRPLRGLSSGARVSEGLLPLATFRRPLCGLGDNSERLQNPSHPTTSPAPPSLDAAPTCCVWCGVFCRVCAGRMGFRLWARLSLRSRRREIAMGPSRTSGQAQAHRTVNALGYSLRCGRRLVVPRALSASPASRALVRGSRFRGAFAPRYFSSPALRAWGQLRETPESVPPDYFPSAAST
jgi:hypothetical protein